jgi:hypothetical protein
MPAVSNKVVERRRDVRWIAAPLALLLVTFGMLVYAIAIQARARAILHDVSALKVGISSLGEVEALAARHKWDLREKHCDDGKCFVAFEIYNTWLHRLKLEPVARFRASIAVKGGTVDSISIMLSRDTRVFPTFPSAGITEEYRKAPEHLGNSATPYSFPTPVGKPYLWVVLTTQANAVQREHAYAYSLTCLVKPGGGCDLPCDYLPLAWHDWEAELETDGFGVGGFGDYYPNRQRCK